MWYYRHFVKYLKKNNTCKYKMDNQKEHFYIKFSNRRNKQSLKIVKATSFEEAYEKLEITRFPSCINRINDNCSLTVQGIDEKGNLTWQT